MKYYIIAGEASGDLHGSNLIKQLKLKDANAEFTCWGGDAMQELHSGPRSKGFQWYIISRHKYGHGKKAVFIKSNNV